VSASAPSPSPLISVVVCTRNRAELLRGVLDDLRAQTLPATRYEVLIVDNGSTDHTRRVVEEVAHDGRFRHVEEPVLGLSHARNRGWREARGAYVAYTDDDCRVPPGWLAVAAEVIGEHRPHLLGGPIEPFFDSPPPPWFRPAYLTRSRGDQARRLSPGENLWGGNLFVGRELLAELGGFPTGLGMVGRRIAYGEETALQHRLYEVHPEAVSYYDPRLGLRHLERPEKLRARWLLRRFVAKGRDVHLAAAAAAPPAPSRVVLVADMLRTGALLLAAAILRSVVRDRRRFPYYQNFLYETASQYLRRLGRLGAQLRQPR
jgi:glucosyl-dolichyl phosphate glucuronosyltransferase